MTEGDVVLLPSSSTMEGVVKDVVSSSSNLDVEKVKEDPPVKADPPVKVEAAAEKKTEEKVGEKQTAKKPNASSKVDAVKLLQSLTPLDDGERDGPEMEFPQDPWDALWEAQAACLRTRGSVNRAMDTHFGETARDGYKKQMWELMGDKYKLASEICDAQCDAAMVMLGNYLRIGMDKCSDQLDATLAYVLNEPVIAKEVVSDGPAPTFTDLTDTDGTRTEFDTDTDTGWESSPRGRMPRSRSENQYISPMNSKKTKRKMFKNLMSAAEKSRNPAGIRQGKSRRNKKGAHSLQRSQSAESSGFFDDKQRHGASFDPSASHSTVPQSNVSVIDVTGAEVDKISLDKLRLDNMKQSYRKYGVRDEDGITHIDLLEEHVDLVENHIDLVDIVDEDREDLIDLTEFGDRTSTW